MTACDCSRHCDKSSRLGLRRSAKDIIGRPHCPLASLVRIWVFATVPQRLQISAAALVLINTDEYRVGSNPRSHSRSEIFHIGGEAIYLRDNHLDCPVGCGGSSAQLLSACHLEVEQWNGRRPYPSAARLLIEGAIHLGLRHR